MAKKTMMVLVVFMVAAIWADVCWVVSGNRLFLMMNTINGEVTKPESWSDWAKNKFEIGSKSLDNKGKEEMKVAILAAASKSTKIMNKVAFGTATYASQKAREKARRMKDKASNVATNIKITISEIGTNKAKQSLESSSCARNWATGRGKEEASDACQGFKKGDENYSILNKVLNKALKKGNKNYLQS